MKTIAIYLAALTVLSFSACKVSNDIQAPKDQLPQVYRNAAGADTNTIANIQWKQFFTNSELQQLIDSAIINNYDMQAALKNIEAAQLIVKQSKLGYLPEATLQVTGTINRPSDNSLNGLSLNGFLGRSYIEDYTAGAALSWEADVWGKIKNQKAAANAGYLQTTEAIKAIQTNLIASIAKGYYNLLMLDAQVAIAKKNLLLNDSTLTIIKLQYNSGDVTALAVQQAVAQQLVAAQLIPLLEQEIAIQENANSILSGAAPNSIKRGGDNNEIISAVVTTGVPSALLQNRPDIRIKELQLNIANAKTGIAKANMYPSLVITAAGGINSFKASNWFNIPASLFGAATGGITQPLFKRKELRTKYEVAKTEREKAVIEFRQSFLIAVGDVSDALVKVTKLSEQRSIASSRVNTLQQAIGNADLLFKNGMANYLEVITAQSNVLQSELALAVLQKEQATAVIDLYRSLGGGWR